jgi:hypothetical protein
MTHITAGMAKVRIRTVKNTLANADVQSLFNSAIGGDDAAVDINIAWPKFKRVRRHTLRMVTLMKWLSKRPWLAENFAAEAGLIEKFVATLDAEYITYFSVPDLDAHALVDDMARHMYGDGSDVDARDDFIHGLETAPADAVAGFTKMYKAAVESDLVNTAVATCSNLTPHKASIGDRSSFNHRFLKSAGLNYAPIPGLPAANFKAFYQCGGLGVKQKEGIMVFLHKLYHVTHDAYEAANLPDINVDEFVCVIQDSLKQVKGQIPRCEDAFLKLSKSIEMLRGNFGRYYKDSKHSGNPGLLMENFVMDVAKDSSDSSVKVRMQFKSIITYYQKMSASQPKDPRTAALFREIDSNFAELQRREASADDAGVPEDAGPEDAGPEDAEPEEGPPPADDIPMTASERAARKVGVVKNRKAMADARRNTARSIEAYMAKHGSAPSALAQEIAGLPPSGVTQAPP